jgi:hypothetical protein
MSAVRVDFTFVKWLLYAAAPEVVGSNLGRNTGCPSAVRVPRFRHDRFLSNPVQFTIRQSPYRRALCIMFSV